MSKSESPEDINKAFNPLLDRISKAATIAGLEPDDVAKGGPGSGPKGGGKSNASKEATKASAAADEASKLNNTSHGNSAENNKKAGDLHEKAAEAHKDAAAASIVAGKMGEARDHISEHERHAAAAKDHKDSQSSYE